MSSRRSSVALTVADSAEQNINRFGVVTEHDFEPLSNFIIEILCEVKASKDSGFLCEVTIHNPSNPEEPSYQGQVIILLNNYMGYALVDLRTLLGRASVYYSAQALELLTFV